MLTVATVLALLAIPMAAVTVLLLVVGRVQRAREAEIGRRVSVTDAIHSELGAVVSPVVKRRFGRGWRIEIAVPFERPAIVGRVVGIAHAAMLRADARAESEREVMAWTGTSTSRASS